MRGTVAVVIEQGQVFSIVAVKDSAVQTHSRDETLRAAQAHFGPRTAILGKHRHQAYGPKDIVQWLGDVHPGQLPWREFTLPA